MSAPAPVRKKARIVAFHGRSAPLRDEALAEAIRHQCQALAQDAEKLLLLTELSAPVELLFARQVLDLGLPLVAVLPAKTEDLQKTSPPAAWSELEPVLRQAARVDVLSAADKALAPGWKLVDEADVLLIFEPAGVPDEETARLVAYAQRLGREVIALREKADSPAVEEIHLQAGGASADAGFDALLKNLEEQPPPAACPDELVRYAKACSEEANRIAPAYRKYFLSVVLANAIAAMAGTVQIVFAPPHTVESSVHLPFGFPLGRMVLGLILIKLFCVAAGAIIFLVLQIRKSQTRWINARLKAEMCRSAKATWRLPRLTEALAMGGQPEARETLQFIRCVRATSPRGEPVSVETFKADYGFNRMRGQFRYYLGQADTAMNLSRWLTPLYWLFTALSLLTGLVVLIYPHVFNHHGETPGPGTWRYFLLGFIPIMAPALASWILAWDAIETLARRKARYREMQELLRRELADLVQAKTWEALTAVVEQTEKLLLSEVLEWYSFIKYSK
jgi:hypothetical protein